MRPRGTEPRYSPTTDGEGPSLELIDPTVADLNRWSDPAGWQASSTSGGSPGGTGTGGRIVGDSNGDGIFDSSDLVAVFAAGKYEDGIEDNATFDEGDWSQDGDFDTSDLVAAFQAGHYVAAARPLDADAEIAAAVDWLLTQDDNAKKSRAFVA